MSTPDKSPAKLVYMANQIGTFFISQDKDTASAKIAEHIRKFWDPRMRTKIIAYLESGGENLDPQSRDAVRLLCAKTAPPEAPGGAEKRSARGISRFWRRYHAT